MKINVLAFLLLILSFYGHSQSCTLAVTLSTPDSTICLGSNVMLTAKATAGTAPYKYSWSTGDTSSKISVNKAGIYTVIVTDLTPGCQPVTKSIKVTSTPPPAAPTAKGVFVCHTGPAVLVATSPGGTYQWYDAANGGNFLASGDTLLTPSITGTRSFYVQTTIGSCTSARTMVTVTMANKPSVSGSTVCFNSPAVLTASGADSYVWYDSPVAGNILSTSPTYATKNLRATTTFYLEATTNGCTQDRIPVVATVTISPPTPVVAATSTCSGNTANLHADVTSGTVNWYNVPTGGVPLITSPDFTTPVLTESTTYYVENSLNGCISLRIPVKVTVNPNPSIPANQIDSTCYNSNVTLTASANPTGTYQWYDAPIGGNLVATGNTFVTPALRYTTIYYLQNSNTTCSSVRATVKVVVKPHVSSPSVSHPLICPGTSVTLNANSPGGFYQWYDAATGGTLLATGPSFTTPILTVNTTYYVQTTIQGCVSNRVAVPVKIITSTDLIAVANANTCSGTSITLRATGSTNGYTWYDSQTGGNLLFYGATFVTPQLTKTTTYYVETTSIFGCTSPRTAVTVTVDPIPTAPKVNSPAPVCPGNTVTLTATSASGVNQWFNTGGKLIATGDTYVTPPLYDNITYYVQNVNGGCVSPRTAASAKVISVANPQFAYETGTACSLAASLIPVIYDPAGGTFSAEPAGLVFANNHTGEINLPASKPGIYSITFVGNGPCPGPTVSSIDITPHPNAEFSYNSTYCKDGANPTPSYPAGSSGGFFTASPSGLVFKNKITGEINLAASQPGSYTVTNNMSGSSACLNQQVTAKISILAPVTISAGSNQTVSFGTPVQLNGNVTGAAARWSGGKGTFSHPNAGNAIYTPAAGETQDTLTYTSADPTGPCGPKSASVVITFTKPPVELETCVGSSIYLAAPSSIPGNTFQWYDAATGGTLLATGQRYLTPALSKTTTYYVQGSDAARVPVIVNVTSALTAPTVNSTTVCQDSSAYLTATGSPGNYEWYDAPTGGYLLATTNTFQTPNLGVTTSYYVQASLNDCISPRTKVTLTVVPIPNITSPLAGIICSGDVQNYQITTDSPTAGIQWSRAKITGISNDPVTNQSTTTINEALINTSGSPINVVYNITASNGTCTGTPFNYVVTVYPKAKIISPDTVTLCGVSADNYAFKFNTPSTTISWSRAAIPGISNLAVAGQASNTLKETLYNTTNVPVNAVYTVESQTPVCQSAPFDVVIVVNPTVKVTSTSSGMACSGEPFSYPIVSNVPVATFVWSRPVVNGISNAAVSNKTTDTIKEALINTSPSQIRVTYTIIPYAYGCAGNAFNYTVTVNPVLTAPVVRSNSPVCINSTIQLNTTTINGAVYSWTGPNGFTSALQNPTIKNVTMADSGIYKLNITVNGCTSPTASIDVKINQLPHSNAGPDQTVCRETAGIKLAGIISGGTTTGVWSTNGSGTFSPAANQLDAVYVPSAADRLVDFVVLTLSSTSKDDCSIATSTMKMIYSKFPGSNAGTDQEVCTQIATAALKGKIYTSGSPIWSTSGTGKFTPSANVLNPTYVGSDDDIKSGSVTLTLFETSADSCYIHSSAMKVSFIPPPTVNAGGTKYVLAGNPITLTPAVSESNVHYSWSPNINIDNDTLKNPVITGDINRNYTLTVTDSRGCITQDEVTIKVSPSIKVPNVFTPNGDGVNDNWEIQGLVAYVNATVDIFDRAGQSIYHSIGYNKTWDGTMNGKTLPSGTYYYVINTKLNDVVLSGPVTIIR